MTRDAKPKKSPRVVGQHLSGDERDEILRLGRELPVLEVMRRTGAARNTINATLRAAGVEPKRVELGLAPPSAEHPQRAHLAVHSGVVIVASDAHYWPGPASVAHRALVKFCAELEPVAFVLNGDAFDGASISRHPPIGWEDRPTVAQEVEACQERLAEIVDALPRRAARTWCCGNHDLRFETRLATVAPEYARVHGIHLKDHFPEWPTAWSCFVNDDVVVKHRFKGGLWAPANNALWGGRTMVTGHLHSAKTLPVTDYNGTRWGVDTGCIADPYAAAFTDYLEDGPRNWIQAFAVLTFHKGVLLWPELVVAVDKASVQFRGQLIRV